MIKLKICYLFAYLSLVVYGSQDNVSSVCLLQDPPNQCGQFCLTALKPMLDHIGFHQQEWSLCGATKINETQSKLDRIEEQQTSVRETLTKLETSVEVKDAAWKKDLESRLEGLESGQNKLENQQTLILEELSRISKMIILLRFEPIGSTYFYIENSIKQNWTSADRSCREIGGRLASFKNDRQFNAIQAKLRSDWWYWAGTNDLDEEGQYVYVASGRPAYYFRWGSRDPDDWNHSQNCVLIGHHKMWDSRCSDPNYFICQAEDES